MPSERKNARTLLTITFLINISIFKIGHVIIKYIPEVKLTKIIQRKYGKINAPLIWVYFTNVGDRKNKTYVLSTKSHENSYLPG